MKKLYILAGAFLMTTGAFAQGHDLFFSAYNEGAHASGTTQPGGTVPSTGQEYAIQIFNPTTATVDMGKYSVARYSNGGTTIFQEEQCMRNKNNAAPNNNNNLTSGDVFVIGSEKATLNDILSNWDQQSAPYGPITGPTIITYGGPVTFNGNDAMVLRRWTGASAGQGTPIMVDLIGVIGQDPAGGAWFTNPPLAPVTVATKNMSLVRKGNIENGTMVNNDPNTYQIGDEWEVFSAWDANPANTYGQSYANLSGHAADFTGTYGTYLATGVLEDFNNAISVFPNPANKEVKIKIDNKKVASIVILNGLGQNIRVMPTNTASQDIRVDVSTLKAGLYFVQFIADDAYHTKLFKTLVVQ